MTFAEANDIFHMPLMELLYRAHTVHKENFDVNKMQLCTLLSIQTGGCPEDCAYCAQSKRNKQRAPMERITEVEKIVAEAQEAREMGCTRFCLGASGRRPSPEVMDIACEAIARIKQLGLKACCCLGTLSEEEVLRLKSAGLDYYNHNIDTSPQHYKNIITTRTIDERMETIRLLQKHGIKVCTGGILGIGESNNDRISMLLFLKTLDSDPNLITINRLVKIPGTPLENAPDIEPFDFVRFVALASIMMPHSYVKLCAGRETMSEELQALCFFAGANSMFIGKKLLTVDNANFNDDMHLLQKLGIKG
ncbi:MAG: biotin synthase BioB [Alphaproteobacteria bacterium]|nr:biotin synthase BioB [Alphaproteobacteria bacterium]